MKTYYLNGKMIPKAEALIHVDDLGLLRGFGIFDFFTVRGGRPLFMPYHLTRFQNSAKGIGMSVPISPEELEKAVYQVMEANKTFDSGIRIVMTGGYSLNGFTPAAPNLIIFEQDFQYPDPELYVTGAKLLLHEYTRTLPLIKTNNYIVPILEFKRVEEAGAFDLLYHEHGFISESSRSNFFAVLPDNKIITPKDNVLGGITRHHALQVAKYTGYETSEGPLSLGDLSACTEAFLTSSVKGIMPVTRVDDQIIGNGKPGPISKELMAYWEDYVQHELEKVEAIG